MGEKETLKTKIYDPDYCEAFPLSAHTTAVLNVNCAHQITAVFGNWGQIVDNSELAKTTGFNNLFQTPGNYTRDQAVEEESSVLQRAIQLALKYQCMSNNDIRFVVVGSGSPMDVDCAGAIATKFEFENTQTLNCCLACNSGTYALNQAYKLFPGQKGLIIAVDGLTGVRIPGQPYKDISDEASRQIFSNGITVLAVEIGTGINLVPLVIEANPQHPIDQELKSGLIIRPDVEGVIRAHMTYNDLIDPEGELVQVIGNTTCIRLLQSVNGKALEMDPIATSDFFSSEFPPLLERVLELYLLNINPNATEITILLHHASKVVITNIIRHLKQYLRKHGKFKHLKINIPWFPIYGNSSGATLPIVLAYYLKQMKPGQDIICASMGAGATFTFLCPVFQY